MIKLDKKEERIIVILIGIVISIACIYKYLIFKPSSVKIVKKIDETQQNENKVEEKKIYVYVVGEVKKPGVYILMNGDRIDDAINMAGGFTDSADLTCINLVEKLKDEQLINIYTKNQEGNAITPVVRNPLIGGKLNINIATVEEIDKALPGIGETLASSIVSYRNKNGKFKSIDEITKVDGIGSGKRYQKIKDLIILN